MRLCIDPRESTVGVRRVVIEWIDLMRSERIGLVSKRKRATRLPGFPIPVVGGHTPGKSRNRSVVFFRRVKRIGRVATFEDRAETALRADFYFVVAGTGYRCPAEE